jgi:hypothetical protein
MIQYLGSYTVGGLFPTMVTFMAGVIPRLRGQLAGAMRISGTLQVTLPSIDARIAATARLAAQLALTPPGVKFNAAANAQLIALLQAQLAIIADLNAAFGNAGVDALLYDGTAGAMGQEITQATGGGLPGGLASDHVNAFVLATRYPSTFTAMGKVFFA